MDIDYLRWLGKDIKRKTNSRSIDLVSRSIDLVSRSIDLLSRSIDFRNRVNFRVSSNCDLVCTVAGICKMVDIPIKN